MMRGLVLAIAITSARAIVYDFVKQGGAIPNDDALSTEFHNGAALNASLKKLAPGDSLVVPNGTFHIMGGIVCRDKTGITLSIDGTLVLSTDMKAWPRRTAGAKGKVMEFLHFSNVSGLTITSSNTQTGLNGADAGGEGVGLIDGKGATWWGIPGVGYLERGENRPRLIAIDGASSDVLLERIFFKDPPYWTTILSVVRLEVRDCKIEAWRISQDSHTTVDMTAFNTDGFDVHGRDIHIHHCTVWNQDDSFCVKDNTQNVLVEHVNSSGIGLTIGSIASVVRNVTFRNIYMHHTYKGIYMKFRGNGEISDILYENIVMDEPESYPIWIGPAQQSDDPSSPCAAHPCSLCWPTDPWAKCLPPPHATYANITLRNISINSPGGNPGVILASNNSQMQHVVFENVVVNHPSTKNAKWGSNYLCQGVASGVATGSTTPVPPCFEDHTIHGSAL